MQAPGDREGLPRSEDDPGGSLRFFCHSVVWSPVDQTRSHQESCCNASVLRWLSVTLLTKTSVSPCEPRVHPH